MDLSDNKLIHYHLTEREMKSYAQPFYSYFHAAVHTLYMHGRQWAENFCLFSFCFPENLRWNS